MIHDNIYVCPVNKNKLMLCTDEAQQVFLKSTTGLKYYIKNGIPDFTYPKEFTSFQHQQYEYYEKHAEIYDDLQEFTFLLQNLDEHSVRKKMLKHLHLQSHSKVLELACGTGRDSENIATLLSNKGELFVQDLSIAMLKQCKKRLARLSIPIDFSVGNATYLAFPTNYFDAVFSFGGLNVFENTKLSLQEMVRVTKPGGRIVVGDESLPPWLYDSEFGKILLNANPLFKFEVPLSSIPVEARDVSVQWIIGGVYYLISFTVGEGEPIGNFDLELPGKRGGTLKTRYYGKLEGVTNETKDLVMQAVTKSNQSIHKWLDHTLKVSATNQLKKEK